MDAAAAQADFPSGPWTGYYQQFGRRHPQDLELTFADGVVRGGGWDAIGEFAIRGRYDSATGEVRWTKRYPGSHAVHYRGFREGKGIWGTWEIPGFDRSGFHIWPLGAGAAAAATERAAADEPVRSPRQPTPLGEPGS